MDTAVFSEKGKSILNKKGELICKSAFPSMPLKFWNDPGKNKYKKAYFSKFRNIWYHGDYAERKNNGSYIIYGRSDATLNPGGVRLGTAEIYSVVEKFKEVKESIVVGQSWDNDVRVILFVVLSKNNKLNFSLFSSACLMNLFRRQRDAFGITLFSESLDFHRNPKVSKKHLVMNW